MTRLDAELIRQSLESQTTNVLDRFEVFAEIESTNTWLANQPPPPAGHVSVALAEHQTAGRGRLQRKWISAPGSSLCLSVGYLFRRAPANLPPLTLALGVGSVRALTGLAVQNLRVKWPNDLLVGDDKLGGILTETQVCNNGNVSVVAGIGINIGPPDTIAGSVESDWSHSAIGLCSTMAVPPSREGLAAALIDAALDTFTSYDEHGFKLFERDFNAIDWLAGQAVVVETPIGDVAGIATGIDESGALLVDGEAGRQTIVSGSIRHAENARSDKRVAPR
ncbi:MAG: biotin--[acetyl-CoA-carboxylase] ligase [Gammaproteobacteria bacterium]|nr:biotin--[acetyl-CoA-carboxylase] ligase [Gammaproteobacteria bacterium]